jgi:hypothetical protein
MMKAFKEVAWLLSIMLMILVAISGWWLVETTYYYLWHKNPPERFKMEKQTPPTNLVTTLDEP